MWVSENGTGFATTEMENASSEMQSAARNFMDARKLVSQGKSERRFLPVVGAGVCDGLQSVPAGAKALGKREGASPSTSRGRAKEA